MSSNAQFRVDVAAALSTVAGVNGHTHTPAVMNAGDAWPQWRGCEPVARAVENTWVIFVVIGAADDVAADAWADDHLDAVLDALRSHLYVDRVDPALIPTDAGDLTALTLLGRSE